MTFENKDVAVIGDGNSLLGPVCEMISEAFTVSTVELSRFDRLSTALKARSVVCCLHNVPTNLHPGAFTAMGVAPKTVIFLFPTYKKENIDQAKRFGAETCLVAPVERAELRKTVKQAINENVEAAWSNLKKPEQEALRSSLQSFDSLFDAIIQGKRLPVSQVYSACDKIKDSLDESNVDRWLGALRHHHNSTYRHSMYVCGSIAFFGYFLGVRGEELRRLTVGGFLHDAGKAHIPLEILDKPAKLEKDEWAIMRQHPEHSRAILMRESGLSEEIVKMAVHHHEKLDGTGYPDGLGAAQLDDHARITAIADVFSALIEERAYKPALPPEKALDMMAGFEGHLDLDLVRAFREFVLAKFVAEASA